MLPGKLSTQAVIAVGQSSAEDVEYNVLRTTRHESRKSARERVGQPRQMSHIWRRAFHKRHTRREPDVVVFIDLNERRLVLQRPVVLDHAEQDRPD